MILHLHPTGNSNVRAVMGALENAGLLGAFATTVGFSEPARWQRYLPDQIGGELARRNYGIRREQLITHPGRELLRLVAVRMGWTSLIRSDRGFVSIAKVAENFSQYVARKIPSLYQKARISGVYAYDHAALEVFQAAKALGLSTIFELPIAYWETAARLLQEEAERFPAWQMTLDGITDLPERQERKTRELTLADTIICPSQFVMESIPPEMRVGKRCVLAPFGTPAVLTQPTKRQSHKATPLRVLFVGILSQRKGLGDLFDAIRILKRPDIELVILGRTMAPMRFYRQQGPAFTYEAPRPHRQVLELMQSCDVFVFPSIVEGRALVQQEAMACGLPLIVTPNAGGEDLIIEGQTGFLVPIRRPDIIAERLAWCADHREEVSVMGEMARRHATGLTWASYGHTVVRAVVETLAVNGRTGVGTELTSAAIPS